jgi:hypothetical protein
MRAAELAAQDWADLAMHELTACSLADPAVVESGHARWRI